MASAASNISTNQNMDEHYVVDKEDTDKELDFPFQTAVNQSLGFTSSQIAPMFIATAKEENKVNKTLFDRPLSKKSRLSEIAGDTVIGQHIALPTEHSPKKRSNEEDESSSSKKRSDEKSVHDSVDEDLCSTSDDDSDDDESIIDFGNQSIDPTKNVVCLDGASLGPSKPKLIWKRTVQMVDIDVFEERRKLSNDNDNYLPTHRRRFKARNVCRKCGSDDGDMTIVVATDECLEHYFGDNSSYWVPYDVLVSYEAMASHAYHSDSSIYHYRPSGYFSSFNSSS